MIEILIGLIVLTGPIAVIYGIGFLTLKIIKGDYNSHTDRFTAGIIIVFSLGGIILSLICLYLLGEAIWTRSN
jgi:hypothetical protein